MSVAYDVILVLGAGRSSSALIRYLLEHSSQDRFEVWVADLDLKLAEARVGAHTHGKAKQISGATSQELSALVQQASIVISLLPPDQHFKVAELCLLEGKSLLTASYVSDAIRSIAQAFQKKGLLLLMECGLDPGIDHMSAMREIDLVRQQGGEITSFKSYTGGLIAPESDNNPWHYKVTWNPRNVVLAGQGTAQFIEEGAIKFVPYQRLFERTAQVQVEGYGEFEGYPNRDSLSYRGAYQLENVPTFIRGTLRRPPYCAAWNLLVQLGMTDDTVVMESSEDMSYCDFTRSFLPADTANDIRRSIANYLLLRVDDPHIEMLAFLGLFSEEKIGLAKATPAKVLQQCIEKHWKLSASDKDMIVMVHELGYELNGARRQIQSSLVVIGEDSTYTAMAKTVGLPLGIAARRILKKEVTLAGLQIPVSQDWYSFVLDELAQYGVQFLTRES